jgi:PRTRC genetic system protein B
MKTEITASIDGASEMVMTRAICIYESKTPKGKIETVATVHPVTVSESGAPLIMPGVGASLASIEDLVIAMSQGSESQGFIEANMLSISMQRMIWWKPSHVERIWFKVGKGGYKCLNGAHVTHPALLFMATPSTLSVFALKQNRRPTPETVLCDAPYFNIYPKGNMCRGTAEYPKLLSPNCVPMYEKAFFESNFTHSCNGELTKHPGGHRGLWLEMKGKKQKDFPAKYLKATTNKVSDLLKP